jgi:hypothetical protein
MPNFFKKIQNGNNFFKKLSDTGSNFFKKSGEFLNNLPHNVGSIQNTVRNIANEVQKKASQYAPMASSIALSLGRPDIAGAIGAGASMISGANNRIQNFDARNILSQ